MADRAIRREAGRGVFRVGRDVVGCQVTAGALRRSVGELVVGVAANAFQAGVGTGEEESYLTVIKGRPQPPSCYCMANRAILWEPGATMVRILGAVVSRLMAGPAPGADPYILIVRVALGAHHRRVRSGQRELRLNRMIEFGPHPLRRRVAD